MRTLDAVQNLRTYFNNVARVNFNIWKHCISDV